MRILHAADLHLDSPFQALDAGKAALRRAEQRLMVDKIVSLANEKQADVLAFAGDVFDSENVFSETIQYLAISLKKAEMPVFIAPGNHDYYSARSAWEQVDFGPNVHIFKSEKMECISLPETGCRIWGSAFTSRSRRAPLADFEAIKDGDLVDVMILHAEVGKEDSPYAPVRTEQIERSGMDYIAFGHIHNRSALMKAGGTAYAWPGCPEGRGFDEQGIKGVYLAEVNPEETTLSFVPLGGRRYETVPVDISETEDTVDYVLQTMKDKATENIYQVILSGECENAPDFLMIEKNLNSRFFSVRVKDKTIPRRELWEEADKDSLRGLFLRRLFNLYEKSNNDSMREQIVQAARWGIRALDGGEDLFPFQRF